MLPKGFWQQLIQSRASLPLPLFAEGIAVMLRAAVKKAPTDNSQLTTAQACTTSCGDLIRSTCEHKFSANRFKTLTVAE
jgi:hypothetical protein